MVLKFIRSRVWLLLLLFICCGIFYIVLDGYSMPAAPVMYAGAVCAFVIVIYIAVDFSLFYIKNRRLCRCLKKITLTPDGLPRPADSNEQVYSDMLCVLYEENVRLKNSHSKKLTDMSDYYTLWAHQIKVPIAALRLILQSGDYDAAEISEQVQKIEQYTDTAMCYARISSDSTDFVFRECSLDELVLDAVKSFYPQLVRKKLSLDVERSGKRAVTDKKWLGFVLGQVISNAVKYTEKGGIKIFFEEPAKICIKDTGIGISAEDIPRIFEKGFTGLNGRTDAKSSGIGLYLCSSICLSLGHTISAESGEDGTTVRIDVSRKNIDFE